MSQSQLDQTSYGMLRARVLFIEGKKANEGSHRKAILGHFRVTVCSWTDDVVKKARTEQPDLILAECIPMRSEQLEICEKIRVNEATRHIPIAVILSKESESERVAIFEKGLDETISLPVSSRELLARLSSKIRRVYEFKGIDKKVFCGNLIMDLEKLEARINGQLVQLSVLEFNLLKYFVENKGRVLSRRKILEAVWRDSVVTDRTVDTHIAGLRRKLGTLALDHVINTVYGAGYTFKSKKTTSLEFNADQLRGSDCLLAFNEQ